jgi:hypothetical protein
VVFEHPGGEALLRFEFERNGAACRGGLRFEKVRAYRFRSEGHCTTWHVEGVYDTLAEVSGSEKVAAEPPVHLFHRTSPQAWMTIQRDGLQPMSRQYVHLSADIATAEQVGRRKSGTPLILIINAKLAHDGGTRFGEATTWSGSPTPWRPTTSPLSRQSVRSIEVQLAPAVSARSLVTRASRTLSSAACAAERPRALLPPGGRSLAWSSGAGASWRTTSGPPRRSSPAGTGSQRAPKTSPRTSPHQSPGRGDQATQHCQRQCPAVRAFLTSEGSRLGQSRVLKYHVDTAGERLRL